MIYNYICSICFNSIDNDLNNDEFITITNERSPLMKKSPTVQLSCNHSFHKKCLQEWYKNHIECPVCKTVDYTQFQLIYNNVKQFINLHKKEIYYLTLYILSSLYIIFNISNLSNLQKIYDNHKEYKYMNTGSKVISFIANIFTVCLNCYMIFLSYKVTKK